MTSRDFPSLSLSGNNYYQAEQLQKCYCHLTVEANGWNRVEILVQFHHVERCGFPGPVQSDHDDVEELASTLQWEGVQESVGVFSCHLECTEETRQGS